MSSKEESDNNVSKMWQCECGKKIPASNSGGIANHLKSQTHKTELAKKKKKNNKITNWFGSKKQKTSSKKIPNQKNGQFCTLDVYVCWLFLLFLCIH